MATTYRTCSIDGCEKRHEARGYCNAHYLTLRRTGNPLPKHEWGIWERLKDTGWSVTDRGCWEWAGTRLPAGYGLITAQKHGYKDALTHRVSYAHFNRPIPDGLLVRHKCDNPPCINPEHLELGTYSDNNWDKANRGRDHMSQRTHCKRGHDLRLPDAFKYSKKQRDCRLCHEYRISLKKKR